MGYNLYRTRHTGRRFARRGITLVETLVASLMAGVCLAGITSYWSFAYSLTAQTDQLSVAYNLGRHATEEARETGFSATPEGTSVLYYDNQGGSESATLAANHSYSVTTVVSSDLTVNGSSPVQPAPNALRTVTITVTLLSTGRTVYQTSTYFAKAGV